MQKFAVIAGLLISLPLLSCVAYAESHGDVKSHVDDETVTVYVKNDYTKNIKLCIYKTCGKKGSHQKCIYKEKLLVNAEKNFSLNFCEHMSVGMKIILPSKETLFCGIKNPIYSRHVKLRYEITPVKVPYDFGGEVNCSNWHFNYW